MQRCREGAESHQHLSARGPSTNGLFPSVKYCWIESQLLEALRAHLATRRGRSACVEVQSGETKLPRGRVSNSHARRGRFGSEGMVKTRGRVSSKKRGDTEHTRGMQWIHTRPDTPPPITATRGPPEPPPWPGRASALFIWMKRPTGARARPDLAWEEERERGKAAKLLLPVVLAAGTELLCKKLAAVPMQGKIQADDCAVSEAARISARMAFISQKSETKTCGP